MKKHMEKQISKRMKKTALRCVLILSFFLMNTTYAFSWDAPLRPWLAY